VIRKGDIVEILPEWQDDGDGRYICEAVSDEDLGRVDIRPRNFEYEFAPIQTVRVEMIHLYSEKAQT
jgi:hypothetical protein